MGGQEENVHVRAVGFVRRVDGGAGYRDDVCLWNQLFGACEVGSTPKHSSGAAELALGYLDLVLSQVRVQGWKYDFEILGQGALREHSLREYREEGGGHSLRGVPRGEFCSVLKAGQWKGAVL